MVVARAWRKSTRCETAACVEVATDGPIVGLRNSNQPESQLHLGAGAGQQFIDGVRAGEFDLPA